MRRGDERRKYWSIFVLLFECVKGLQEGARRTGAHAQPSAGARKRAAEQSKFLVKIPPGEQLS